MDLSSQARCAVWSGATSTMPVFMPPDFARPLDVEAQIRATPSRATVKGMYLERLARVIERQGKREGQRRYVGFKDYPLRELMELVVEAARRVHPELPIREGIRRMGLLVFPTLQESLALRVIFTFAGRDYGAALKRVTQGYAHSQNVGTARLASFEPGEAVVELRDVWNFPDCYQVGVHQGAMSWYERKGRIELHSYSPCDVDLRLRWS